jgi:hypothetical protein
MYCGDLETGSDNNILHFYWTFSTVKDIFSIQNNLGFTKTLLGWGSALSELGEIQCFGELPC